MIQSIKFSSIYILVFLVFSIIPNVAVLTTNEHEPNYRYYSNVLIVVVYIVSIALDIILAVLLVNYLRNKQDDSPKTNKGRKQILYVILSIIFLIWFEIIYASEWYYGFGNHQGGLTEANNWGIIGSIIFLSYLILCSNKKLKIKTILFTLTFILHILLFLALSPINIFNFSPSQSAGADCLGGDFFLIPKRSLGMRKVGILAIQPHITALCAETVFRKRTCFPNAIWEAGNIFVSDSQSWHE